MRLYLSAVLTSLLAGSLSTAESNLTTPQSSQQVLSGDFKPPPVFKNINLVRNTNLDRGFVRETVNVVVENLSKEPQSEYYLPFEYDVLSKLGGLEARDKKKTEKGSFNVRTAGATAALGGDGVISQ